MIRTLWAVAACVVLAACGGGGGGSGGDTLSSEGDCPADTPLQGCAPGDDGGGGDPDNPGDPSGIPEDLAQNLRGVTFSDDGTTIEVTFTGLDGTPVASTYTRRADLDVPGYTAFIQQDDYLDRFFLALGAEGPAGTVAGAIVSDGGQFNEVQQGGFYARTGAFDPPDVTGDQGQVSYAGGYAGITNINSQSGGALLPVPPGGGGPDLPGQPAQVRGLVFLNADFGDGSVNGEVYDRVLLNPVDGSDLRTLDNLSLLLGTIDDDGFFTGNLEVSGVVGQPRGTYGGVFGGSDASHVAGVLEASEHIDGVENEIEIGLFVLTQCGQPGDAPICAGITP